METSKVLVARTQGGVEIPVKITAKDDGNTINIEKAYNIRILKHNGERVAVAEIHSDKIDKSMPQGMYSVVICAEVEFKSIICALEEELLAKIKKHDKEYFKNTADDTEIELVAHYGELTSDNEGAIIRLLNGVQLNNLNLTRSVENLTYYKVTLGELKEMVNKHIDKNIIAQAKKLMYKEERFDNSFGENPRGEWMTRRIEIEGGREKAAALLLKHNIEYNLTN